MDKIEDEIESKDEAIIFVNVGITIGELYNIYRWSKEFCHSIGPVICEFLGLSLLSSLSTW